MSSFVVNDLTMCDAINAIVITRNAYKSVMDDIYVGGVTYTLNRKDQTFGGKTTPGLEKLWAVLYKMNIDACVDRYRDDADQLAFPPMEEKHVNPKGVWFEQNRTPQELAQILKSMECFLYQCAEGNIIDSPLYKELKEVENAVRVMFVEDTSEYKAASYGRA